MLIEKIIQAQSNDFSIINQMKNKGYSLNELDLSIKRLKVNPPKSLDLDYLESYTLKDSLCYALTLLSSESIVDNFGKDLLFFTWVNYRLNDFPINVEEKLLNSYVSESKFNKNNLIKARESRWNNYSDINSNNVMLAYNILTNHEDISSDFLDFKDLIKKHIRPNNNIKDKTLDRLALEFLSVKDEDIIFNSNLKSDSKFGIGMDSMYGFTILMDDMPDAVVCFDFPSEDNLKIYQIQGIVPKVLKKRSFDSVYEKSGFSKISFLNFQEFLIDYLFSFSKKYNFTSLSGISAEMNPWQTKGHMTYDNGLKNYDIPFKNLGFEKKNNGEWYKQLI